MSSFPLLSICVRKMNKFKFLIVHALLSQHELVSQDTVSSCMIFPNELTRRNEKRRREERTSRGEKKIVLFRLQQWYFRMPNDDGTNFITTIVKTLWNVLLVCAHSFRLCCLFFFLLFASTHSHPSCGVVSLICTHEQPWHTHNHIHI